MAAIFNLPPTSTSESVQIILAVSLDPKYVGVAFETSILLSCDLYRSWDIALFQMYFRYWRPSLIYHK